MKVRIEVEGLSKSYGGNARALDEASLTVGPGGVVALLGLNGAGKTTLLRCLGGLLIPDSGEVRFDGQPFSRARLDLRRRLMLIQDSPAVLPDMSVLQHASMCMNVYDVEEAAALERATEAVREFGMGGKVDSPLGEMSRGEGYKGALIGLMAVWPPLWLLDEPFASGMDPVGIAAFKKFARRAAAQGCTVVYTTQILELVIDFSDVVCVLDRGRVVAVDRIEALTRSGQLDALFTSLRTPT